MVREQEEFNEVARAKLRLRAAAVRPRGTTNRVLGIAAGLLPQVFRMRGARVATRPVKANRQGRRSSKVPLIALAGAATAVLATQLLRRRSDTKRKATRIR